MCTLGGEEEEEEEDMGAERPAGELPAKRALSDWGRVRARTDIGGRRGLL